MGFEIGRVKVELAFDEETVLAGAKVRVFLDMGVREFFGLQRTIQRVGSLGSDPTLPPEVLADWEGLYRMLGDQYLESWDLTMGGAPVPATGDGMLSLPFRVANEIFRAWTAVIANVSPPSSAASANGATAPAAAAV